MQTVVTDPEQDLYINNPKEWFKGLMYMIYTKILPLCFTENSENRERDMKKLVSKKSYPYWEAVFTHKTYNPNQDSNYEVLEKVGDPVMNLLFNDLQLKLNPNITHDVLSEIKARYLSKPEQRKKSDRLGLKKWVRIVQNWNQSISEDLIEGLFGVIFILGNLLLGKGEGYFLTNNLMINLYKDDTFDLTYKNSKSKVKEIFEKMHWGSKDKFHLEELGTPIRNDSGDPKRKWTLTLRLTPKAKTYITEVMKQKVNTDIIAEYTDAQKKLVQDKTFDLAVEYLKNQYGITLDWAQKRAEEEENKLFDEDTSNRLLVEGYKKIFFGKNIKSADSQYLQLHGIDENRRERILLSIISPLNVDIINIKKFAVKLYNEHGSLTWTRPIEYKDQF